MDEFASEYIESIKVRNLSKNTIDAYSNDLKKFSDYIESNKEDIKEVSAYSIMAYVQKLQSDKLAQSSIIRSIMSIKSMYKYGVKKKVIKDDPFINFEIPKLIISVPEILTVEEVDKLLNIQDLNTNKGIRDKSMLEMMYATGLKVNELLNLTTFDINTKFSYLKCRGLKNNERIVPFGSYAKQCLSDYMEIRDEFNINQYTYLFLNSKGKKMTRQGFWKIIKFYADKADIKKNINLYTLRHSFAVHLLENGADVKSVQELLGNSSIYSIQKYGDISKKNKLAQVYKNSHPRA
ncbi:MAG: tyrosine-type recombinase/integrase [Bacillota bacterium]|nr:tyrosine-type recombinase/integrase [Bacillota bacterium]